jgi:hypothetical protein
MKHKTRLAHNGKELQSEMENNGQAVDDKGTTRQAGRDIIKRLRDQGFAASDDKLAIALGRPVEQVQAWINDKEPVDDDIIMKARGIAKDRNIKIE